MSAPARADAGHERTNYGLRIDCAKNGCPEPHGEDGEVLPRGNAQPPLTQLVNGHAVTPVERTVTYSGWRDVSTSPAPPCPHDHYNSAGVCTRCGHRLGSTGGGRG